MTNSIDFKALNEAALAHCPDVLERMLPEGRLIGHEFTCGNIAGDSGKSCKININNGVWRDFADPDKGGGDLISLVAAIENVSQYEGAQILADMIGYVLPDREPKKKPVLILPVPNNAPEPDFRHYKDGYPTEIYSYFDEAGRLLGYTGRFNKPEKKANGKYDKEFRPYLYTSQGWAWTGFPIPHPFYGLERLAKLQAGGLVIVVEGEGKADKLQNALGDEIAILAIYGGCQKTKNMNYRQLQGKRLLYWPDKDEPGFKAALEFARKAMPLAESLKIVMPPEEAKETWDCANAIEEGWDKDKILAWIETSQIEPEEFAKLANLEFEAKDKRPIIQYRPGELPRIVRELEASIQGKAWQIDELIVRPVRLPRDRSYNGVKKAKGTSVISPFEAPALVYLASKCANWVKIRASAKGEEEIAINPPAEVIKIFLAAKDDWTLPSLTGLVNCPVIRMDGSVLDKPGYDEITGLYADFDTSSFPTVATNPDRQAALEALAFLKSAIDEFPFKTNVDRSVALAAMLTAVLRPSVRNAPLFAFSAPTPGTGKSTLADLIGIMATGQTCAAMDYNQDEAEFKKALGTILLEGTPVALIDNIIGELNNSFFNSILSQETVSMRILGFSKSAKLSTNLLWLATGNNLTVYGDMTRRALFCTLDAEVEKPADRIFRRDIYQWADSHRGELVNAALTVLRAYQVAGKPLPKPFTPMNNYNAWSHWVRGALLWLGKADPKESQLEIEAHDPEREALRSVLQAWYEHWGDQCVTTKDLLRRGTIINDEPDAQEAFYQTLFEAIPHGRELTGRQLGKWLARHEDRVIDGLKLVDTKQTRQGYIYWRVVKK